MSKSTAVWILAWLGGALALGCGSSGGPPSAVTPPPSAPAATAPLQPPQAVVTACYDCHSERGASVWNVRLAPTYWFAGSARKDLDFSAWAQYDAARQSAELLAIAKSVREGSMPPHDFELLHPSAKLTDAEKAAIVDWTSAAASPTAAQQP